MEIGEKYGELTVTGFEKGGRVRVRCSCGAEKTVLRENLRHGRTRSCGHLQRESARKSMLAYRASQREAAK